jgi:hypothetical protein
MTPNPVTVTEDATLEEIVKVMEEKRVKRLPVLRGDKMVGIVTRANLLHAVADLARDVPDPTADDDHIRNRIFAAIEQTDWSPVALTVTVHNGIVFLGGVISEERSRQAAIVAAETVSGVKKVHDHLRWVEPIPGAYFSSTECKKTKTRQLFCQRGGSKPCSITSLVMPRSSPTRAAFQDWSRPRGHRSTIRCLPLWDSNQMIKYTAPWHTRSTISKWANVMERIGLALTGRVWTVRCGTCGKG